MKKSNAQRELEMSMNWLDVYAEKLEGVPGETISQKINYLLELRKSPQFPVRDYTIHELYAPE